MDYLITLDTRSRLSRRTLIWVAVGVVAFMAWWAPVTARGQATVFLPYCADGKAAPLCRFGVNVTGDLRSYDVQPLRVGWYVDYQAQVAESQQVGVDYFPIIALEQIGAGYAFSIGGREPTTPQQLYEVIDAHPGTYWLIGNEPDRRGFQDDIEPEVYAVAYHDLYHLIKGRDPTARIVAGNIVQPTPLRLQYLDRVLNAYYTQYGALMPVDVWGFHNFVLNEASCTYYAPFFPGDEVGLSAVCWGADIPPGISAVDGLRIDVQDNDDIDIFKQQVVAFREWLAARGYRNTQVFLTEFGILMPPGVFRPDFDDGRVNRFMNAAFDYLLTATDENTGYPADGNRLVQRFSWFSIDENKQHNGFLFDPGKPAAQARTAMGDNFAAFTGAAPDEIDVLPMAVTTIGSPAVSGQGVTTITLEATIANSGNLAYPTQVDVLFYAGEPGQGGALIGVDRVYLSGCGETTTARVPWAVATPGDYRLVVQTVASAAETDVTNNALRSTLTLVTANHTLLLPALRTTLRIP